MEAGKVLIEPYHRQKAGRVSIEKRGRGIFVGQDIKEDPVQFHNVLLPNTPEVARFYPLPVGLEELILVAGVGRPEFVFPGFV